MLWPHLTLICMVIFLLEKVRLVFFIVRDLTLPLDLDRSQASFFFFLIQNPSIFQSVIVLCFLKLDFMLFCSRLLKRPCKTGKSSRMFKNKSAFTSSYRVLLVSINIFFIYTILN